MNWIQIESGSWINTNKIIAVEIVHEQHKWMVVLVIDGIGIPTRLCSAETEEEAQSIADNLVAEMETKHPRSMFTSDYFAKPETN